MSTVWDIILGSFAIVAALVAIATLISAIKSGKKQAQQLGDQIDLLRKQVFGEVYEKAQIKNLQFYLPTRRKRPIKEFADMQKEMEEVELGKEVQIRKGEMIELHVQFWMCAPQSLRFVSWGFLDKFEDKSYPQHPVIEDYIRAYPEKIISELPREIYRDWHGHWHIEFGYFRFIPKDQCFLLCFTVIGHMNGKFPLGFWVSTAEAKHEYDEVLWIEVLP